MVGGLLQNSVKNTSRSATPIGAVQCLIWNNRFRHADIELGSSQELILIKMYSKL